MTKKALRWSSVALLFLSVIAGLFSYPVTIEKAQAQTVVCCIGSQCITNMTYDDCRRAGGIAAPHCGMCR